jgi:hypothetical protein
MWKKIFANWDAALFWTAVGALLGSIMTCIITYMFNRKNKRLLNLSFKGWDKLGAKYSRDKKGRIIDIIITGRMNATLPPITASFEGIVGPPPASKGDTEEPTE